MIAIRRDICHTRLVVPIRILSNSAWNFNGIPQFPRRYYALLWYFLSIIDDSAVMYVCIVLAAGGKMAYTWTTEKAVELIELCENKPLLYNTKEKQSINPFPDPHSPFSLVTMRSFK